MKNLDLLNEARKNFANELREAFANKDEVKMTAAFESYAENVQKAIISTAQEIGETADNTILTKRGFRQLTSSEQKFYNNFVQASKAGDVRQALSGLDVTIPQTIIDSVLDDITNNHPLLDAIGIENTYGSVKAIFATDTKQLAAWGALNTAIAQELAGTITAKDFSTSKVSAFIPVPKDMLDLGATYIDAYVRKILSDGLAYALEDGFINGDGKNKPIGVLKNPDGAVVSGAYPDKTAVKLTSLDVVSYMPVVAKLAKGKGGKTKVISSVDLIVNPVDYLSKVVPATTVLATDGSYKNNLFPFPTNVYQSEMIAEGTAALGQLAKYKACLSTGKEGKIEYSDQCQFIEDNRVYIAKIYATGFAVEENDFLKLDISKLEPLKLSVTLNQTTTS